MNASLQGWMFLNLFCMGSIAGVVGLRQFFVAPLSEPGTNLAWYLMQMLPILATLPGLLRLHLNSTFFLCMGSLLYFIQGVLWAFEPADRVFGGFQIFFSLALCVCSALLIRKIREQSS
ncbi:MAG: DUF2069 domain-containing protein [Pseudomonadota bacterium]